MRRVDVRMRGVLVLALDMREDGVDVSGDLAVFVDFGDATVRHGHEGRVRDVHRVELKQTRDARFESRWT